jgi:branched-chain amino acid transport system substrate-binding protein
MKFADVSRRDFVKLCGGAGVIIGAGLSLAGCGGSSSSTSSGSASSASGAAFKIGHIGPLTGSTAIYGTATSYGTQVAINEVNAAGGDVQFDFKTEDDTGVAETAVNAYNNLKDWGMQILVGTTTTAPCVAVSSETNTDSMFEITPSASSTDVIGGQPDADGNVSIARKKNVFQMCFTDPNQGKVAAQTVKDRSLGSSIGIIYDNSDTYSTGLYNGFKDEAQSQGLNIVSTMTFTADNNTNFSSQLSACKDAGADMLFLPIYYQQAGLILQQAKDMGYAPTFFGCDGMDGILTQEGFDSSLAEGLVLITPFSADEDDEAVQSFAEAYEKLSDGTAPNQFAADAYDCVKAITAAIEKAGVTPDAEFTDICDALVSVFTGGDFSYDGLTGSNMTWDDTGMVSKTPVCFVIQNGKYVKM